MLLKRAQIQAEDLFKEQTAEGKLKFLTNYAILAPSSHNTQPWLFSFSQDELTISPNSSRQLPASDPTGRELYLSLGAAVGNFLIACRGYGLKTETSYVTSGSEPKATEIKIKILDWGNGNYDSALLSALDNRHNSRAVFDNKEIDQTTLNTIIRSITQPGVNAKVITENTEKQKLSDLVLDALEAAFADKAFSKELGDWIKPSLKKYKDGMPGYNLGMPFVVSLFMPWVIAHLPVGPQQRKMNKPLLESSSALLLLSTAGDTQEEWLRAGQALTEVWVAAEQQGVKAGVLAAPIELPAFRSRVSSEFGLNGLPQAFARMGYSAKVPVPTPRLAFNEILK